MTHATTRIIREEHAALAAMLRSARESRSWASSAWPLRWRAADWS